MGVKVAKFGGTSLADAAQFRKVKAIIEMDPDRRYIVNSAPGKRHSTDIKVTDLLYECKKSIAIPSIFEECIRTVHDRFQDIIDELNVELDIKPYIDEIKDRIKAGATDDYTASRGEYLNGIILAKFLGYEFVDPATVILFGADGQLEAEKTYSQVAYRLQNSQSAVIPGFYGADAAGNIVTFSRGGSDITGAIVARSVNAQIYENWTDVSGILAADPRIVEYPAPISSISYRELRELTSMGASVLHEDAVYPVMEAGIPINIKNTNRPHDPGTIVLKQAKSSGNKTIPTGISGKKGFAMLSLSGKNVKSGNQYMQQILKLSEELKLNDKYILSGVDQLSLILQNNIPADAMNEVREKYLSLSENFSIINDVSLITIVGEGLDKKRILAKAALALKEASVEMLLAISSSDQSILIGVRDRDIEKAINQIYKACFMKKNRDHVA